MSYLEAWDIKPESAWTVQRLINFLETIPPNWRVLTESQDYGPQSFDETTIEKKEDEGLLIFNTE